MKKYIDGKKLKHRMNGAREAVESSWSLSTLSKRGGNRRENMCRESFAEQKSEDCVLKYQR